MRQILRDINDLIKEELYREKIRIEDIDRIKKKRYKQEVYRKMIHNYLRKYKK
jgi:nucleosome binding factor SPN SPT16 subunit